MLVCFLVHTDQKAVVYPKMKSTCTNFMVGELKKMENLRFCNIILYAIIAVYFMYLRVLSGV